MCSNRGEAQKVINKGEKSDTKGHVCWIPSTRIGVIVERKGVSLGGGGTKNVLEVGNSDGYAQTYKNHGMNTLKEHVNYTSA